MSDLATQTLVGWRGVEFFAPETLRLTAERIGPRSAYSIFSDRGFPRVELIVDRSTRYDAAVLSQWVERVVKSREAGKWEDVKKSEAEIFGHKALRVTGRAEGSRFVAYAWTCSGVLKFLKINLQQSDEHWADVFRSLRCHRSDGMMLIRLYEFQILVPSRLWISSVNSATGRFSLTLEDEGNVVLIERAGPAAALGLEIRQWLKKYHAKRLEGLGVFIGSEPRAKKEEAGHGALTYPVHPKGLAIRRKTVGMTEVWLCDVNDRYWAFTAIRPGRKTAPPELPQISIDCHAKKL
ncbi:MAG: hypothetical protein QXQ48_05520 [Nitrososphaerota archaeon]